MVLLRLFQRTPQVAVQTRLFTLFEDHLSFYRKLLRYPSFSIFQNTPRIPTVTVRMHPFFRMVGQLPVRDLSATKVIFITLLLTQNLPTPGRYYQQVSRFGLSLSPFRIYIYLVDSPISLTDLVSLALSRIYSSLAGSHCQILPAFL